MKNIFRRRPLAFEQVEQRLALSAAPLNDYVLTLAGDWWATPAFGGAVSFDRVLTAGFGDSRSTLLNFAQDNGFVDIRDGEIVFTGPIFSTPGVEGTLESNEAPAPVTPIPQPQLGDGELAGGIIAVAEIFRPTKQLPAAQHQSQVARSEPVDANVARAADESWKSTSLSRGRDMYFEVAAIADDQTRAERGAPRVANEVVPLVYQQMLMRQEAERNSSTTSRDQAKPAEQLPALPSVPRQETRPRDVDQSDSRPDKGPVEKSERTAQDRDVPTGDEYSHAIESRDEAFAVWREADGIADEAIVLRNENQPGHAATWPMLAALAATGWWARTRRLAQVLPSQRQPLRRESCVRSKS